MILNLDKTNLLRGTILTFVCFDCATIVNRYVSSEKTWKTFTKDVITKDHCMNCNGLRFYIKDQYGRQIDSIELK